MTAVRAITAVAVCCCTCNVTAQQVSPMVLELRSSDPTQFGAIAYSNTATSPVAVETVVTLRDYDISGTASDAPADDALIVSPQAFWASPGQTQNISIRYAGPTQLDVSRMYVVSFREVALKVKPVEPASGVVVRLEFRAVVHVIPGEARSDIQVGERHSATDGNIDIELTNEGSKFARIDEGSLVFGEGADAEVVPGHSLLADGSPAWILPNRRRKLTVPIAEFPLVADQTGRPRWVPNAEEQ